MSLIQVQLELRQLLADIQDANAPRIATLTASDAQAIRKGLIVAPGFRQSMIVYLSLYKLMKSLGGGV